MSSLKSTLKKTFIISTCSQQYMYVYMISQKYQISIFFFFQVSTTQTNMQHNCVSLYPRVFVNLQHQTLRFKYYTLFRYKGRIVRKYEYNMPTIRQLPGDNVPLIRSINTASKHTIYLVRVHGGYTILSTCAVDRTGTMHQGL